MQAPASLKPSLTRPEDWTPRSLWYPQRVAIAPPTGVCEEEQVLANWKKRGATNVYMLHTHDPKVADTEEFAKILRDAKAVWFDGGRQWNIVDSYANTLTFREFHKVLERGGVIGGSSAGATIQGDYLVRGAIAGSEIVMTT